jgi:ligand-binding sensor domain-containing protein
MRKISTLMVSVLCMMMPVGAEAQVPTAFVSKGATDIQAQPHTITQTNSGAQWAPIDPMVRSITMDDGLPSNAVRSVVQGSKGYMWFGTDNGLCRFDGYDVKTYYNPFTTVDQFVSALTACEEGLLVGCNNGAYLFCNATDRFQKLSDKITAPVINFSLDGDQNIWISTNGQGVFRFNRTTHELHQYPMKNIQGKVQSTLVDANNQVWMLCNHGGASIYHLNKSTDQFEAFPLKGDATMFYGMAMLAAPDGNLYVGTWENGLYKLNADGSAEQLISGTLSNAVHHIHQLYNNGNKYILIASDDGLVQYDIQNRSWSMLSEVNDPSRSTNERFVYGIAGDNEGGIWVTTFYGGVSYLPSTSVEERFRAYSARQGGLRGNVVGRFFEDQQHRIWIATDDAGLDCFNPQTNSFVSYPGKAAMGKYNVHALFANGNDLWVGTYGNGVIRMNMATGAQQIFQTDGMVSGSNAYCIYRDRKNRLWAASMDGASLFDEGQQKFSKIKSFKSLTIDIKEDSQGNVWFATQGGGLWRLDKNNVWKQYKHVENDSNSLVSDQVNCLVIGEKGQLYAATGDGLCEFLPSKGVFRRISIEAPSLDFASLVISQGVMWISTSKGIVKYTPGEPVQLFNKYDGLTCDQFMPNAGLLASDGRIYFGSTRGFNCFYPYLVKINQVAPPVAITSVELFGQPIEAGSDQLEKSLSHAAELNLSHNENTINISFAALSYVSPEKNQYAYKLEGVDKDWIYTHEHRANYTNLPAGTYTFLVKATNNDGVWSKNEARLQIVVHPPFWWSLPAKILYLLLIGYAIYWFMQSRLKREKRRHQEELDQLERKQDQEMRDARLQFFTMIAHEIRTPVTLIIGPLESLKEHWKQVSGKLTDGETITQTLSVIDRNAQRLLLLVNQLLDFNKVQQKGMQVHFRLNNISKLMHAVAERFAPTFEQKSICFEVDYPADDLVAMIDQEAITKVISNLMTNALKYTGDYVRLSCRLLEDGNSSVPW